jgi:hypothetical protein
VTGREQDIFSDEVLPIATEDERRLQVRMMQEDNLRMGSGRGQSEDGVGAGSI